MAKAAFKMPEDFLLKLSRLGEKTDEIINTPKVFTLLASGYPEATFTVVIAESEE